MSKKVIAIVQEMLQKDQSEIAHAYIYQSLPSLDEIKDQVLGGKTIGALFEEFYKKAPSLKHEVDGAEIDAQFKDEAYVRFIIQLSAQLTAAKAAGKAEANIARIPTISADAWAEISEALGDTGTNVSVAGLMGIRRHPKDDEFNLYGALAGGLGNKLSHATFEMIQEKLTQDIPDELRRSLHDKLIWADNVIISADGNMADYVPYTASSAQDIKTVRVQTVARESLEELGELIIAGYRIKLREGQDVRFADVMSEALGKNPLSDIAQEIFQDIERIVSDLGKGQYTSKIYKDEVEPLLAEFLKTTPEGKALVEELTTAVGNETVATDRSFPNMTLGNMKKDDWQDNLPGNKAPFILIPKAVCFVVKEHDLERHTSPGAAAAAAPASIFLNLKNAALAVSEQHLNQLREKKSVTNPDGSTKKVYASEDVFEAKGFERADFSRLIDIFCHEQGKADSFAYVHENIAAILACVDAMTDQREIVKADAKLTAICATEGFHKKLDVALNYKTRNPETSALPERSVNIFNIITEALKDKSLELVGKTKSPASKKLPLPRVKPVAAQPAAAASQHMH